MRVRSRLLLLPASSLLFGVLQGCTVGPNYSSPDLGTRLGAAWAESEPGMHEPEMQDLARWWRSFGDDELSELIDRAFSGNLDLLTARERIITARARRGVANADRLPRLDAEAEYARTEQGREAPIQFGPVPNRSFDTFSGGVVAGWEADLWGRVARIVEAADAEIELSREDYRAVRVATAAEVAREVLSIRAIDDRLGVLARAIEVDQEFIEITKARASAGLVSELDLLRAERTASVNRAARQPLRAERRAAEHRIAVLLGERPGSIALTELPQAAAPPLPRLGLPAELLDRRPDVRSAERAYAAAVARIGAAEADRYPRIVFGGSFVLGGSDLGDLADPDTRVLAFGPRVTVPIFEGGRIRSSITLAESEARSALLRLEQSALDAVREVETALARLCRSRDRIAELEMALSAARDSESLAAALYRSGNIDFINVLETRTERLAIEDVLATARLELLSESVSLSVALGGGWEHEVDEVAMLGTAPQGR
ncbi:MAG: efflux transporter outer membrane subunit [Phycisphaeraceae bacterium]|nr:MAG: efflux transporter outer membrane subunit [Phycisphaeraceae bacterium]